MTSDAGREYHFEDFTEDAYGSMLDVAKRRYAFEPFGTEAGGAHLLWRHDVDFSVHRALALAEIEAERELRSTYFLSFHSELYNLLEASITERARRIVELGHWIGLHFDAGFHGLEPGSEQLERKLELERRMLEELLETPIGALSFHNPEATGMTAADSDSLAGMVNAYGRGIRERYSYISDSNGYWRHRRLPELLEGGGEERLHVLTHPEWWQPEPMSPRERLERCISGRAEGTRRWYDEMLARWGRENVG